MWICWKLKNLLHRVSLLFRFILEIMFKVVSIWLCEWKSVVQQNRCHVSFIVISCNYIWGTSNGIKTHLNDGTQQFGCVREHMCVIRVEGNRMCVEGKILIMILLFSMRVYRSMFVVVFTHCALFFIWHSGFYVSVSFVFQMRYHDDSIAKFHFSFNGIFRFEIKSMLLHNFPEKDGEKRVAILLCRGYCYS